MSCVVEWAGRDYDVDPEEFTTRELGLIKERTGLDYPHLIFGVVSGEGDPIRVLFWLIDQRADPGLKFSDYDGPPVKVYKQLIPHFSVLADGLGKATEEAGRRVTAGSAGSPSSTDTAPTSSMP